MKLALIMGTRPEYIQIEPIYKEAKRTGLDTVLINTGQHYDYEMSRVFLKELGLPEPDYHLGIGSGTHGEQIGKTLIVLEKVLMKEKPDITLISGDTNSALGGGLISSRLHIPVAHNEAGMRSYNRNMPEEINRIILDHISDINFVVVPSARDTLIGEGITKSVYYVGDVMYDSYLHTLPIIKSKKEEVLDKIGVEEDNYIVLTLHRVENVDLAERLRNIFHALSFVDKIIVFPMHPRTKKRIEEFRIHISKNVKAVNPLGYIEFLTLLYYSEKILTDSGGVQKQAYFSRKPCITLRAETEWIDTVKAGVNVLVGSDIDKIVDAVNNFTPQHNSYNTNIFGEGNAAEKIIEKIKEVSSHENILAR